MNEYLVPANSKKSALFLGLFNGTDGIIIAIGAVLTVILLVIFNGANFGLLLLSISPALLAAFLVFPVANYHNMMQLITNIYMFYTGNRKYVWKGWCVKDYVKDNNKF